MLSDSEKEKVQKKRKRKSSKYMCTVCRSRFEPCTYIACPADALDNLFAEAITTQFVWQEGRRAAKNVAVGVQAKQTLTAPGALTSGVL